MNRNRLVALGSLALMFTLLTPFSEAHNVEKWTPLPEVDFKSPVVVDSSSESLTPALRVAETPQKTHELIVKKKSAPKPIAKPVISKPKYILVSKPKPVIVRPVIVSGLYRDPEVSWYGPGFYGHRTACGYTLSTTILGVANRTLPCGTKVTFSYNGRSVTVPVIDRGPYVSGRQWDLTGGLCVYLRHCFTGPLYYRVL